MPAHAGMYTVASARGLRPRKDKYMNMKVVEIATDENLLDALRKVADHKPSRDEVTQQRVSFVYGALKSDSGITKEQVKKAIAQEG